MLYYNLDWQSSIVNNTWTHESLLTNNNSLQMESVKS